MNHLGLVGLIMLAGLAGCHRHDDSGDVAALPDTGGTVRDGGVSPEDASREGGPDPAFDAALDALDRADAPTRCGEPRIAGSIAVGGLAFRIDADHGFVHAALSRTGFVTIDARDPADMRVVAEIPFDQPGAVSASGALAVLLAELRGSFPVLPRIHVFDISDRSRPTELFVDDGAVYYDAVLEGGELVAATGVSLVTMDVDAFGASRRGSVAVPPSGTQPRLARDGPRVAVAAGTSLDVVDVSSPASPRPVAHADLTDAARGVAMAGDRVYVAAGSLLAAYVAEGSSLRPLSVSVGFDVEDVARWRDWLVVARYGDVAIVREAMPEEEVALFVPNPTGVGTGGNSVAIDGDVAFVGSDHLVAAIALCPPP